MSVLAILGAVIAALAGAVAVLFKAWRSSAATAKLHAEERDMQAAARKDDAGRLEDVIAVKNDEAVHARENVPQTIEGVRDAVAKLGGKPLPQPGDFAKKTAKKP